MDKGQPPPPPYEAQQAGYQPQNYPPASAPYPPQQQQQYQQYPLPPPQQQQYQQYPTPPQQQQYQQQYQQVTQVVVTQPVSFYRKPVTTICPHCRANVITTVELSSGLMPWLICGGLVLVGCWIGCCLVPFCIDDLKDSVHRCPNCQKVVGQHKILN